MDVFFIYICFQVFFLFFQSVITITLDVSVTTQNDDFAQAKSSLEGNVTNAKKATSMKTIQVSNTETMSLNTVDETPIIGVCVDGSVFGLNQNPGHSQKCRKLSISCVVPHYIALQVHTSYATLSSDIW